LRQFYGLIFAYDLGRKRMMTVMKISLIGMDCRLVVFVIPEYPTKSGSGNLMAARDPTGPRFSGGCGTVSTRLTVAGLLTGTLF
jgi:hypothetical protein